MQRIHLSFLSVATYWPIRSTSWSDYWALYQCCSGFLALNSKAILVWIKHIFYNPRGEWWVCCGDIYCFLSQWSGHMHTCSHSHKHTGYTVTPLFWNSHTGEWVSILPVLWAVFGQTWLLQSLMFHPLVIRKVNAAPNRAASPEGRGSLRCFKVRHRLHVQRPWLLCLSLLLIFCRPCCVIRKSFKCFVPGQAKIITCVSFRSVVRDQGKAHLHLQKA